MRYGTWNLVFADEVGTTPPDFNGAFYTSSAQSNIAGYIPGDAIVADFSYWSAVEITEEQFLTLAKAENPAATINESRMVQFPSPEDLA